MMNVALAPSNATPEEAPRSGASIDLARRFRASLDDLRARERELESALSRALLASRWDDLGGGARSQALLEGVFAVMPLARGEYIAARGCGRAAAVAAASSLIESVWARIERLEALAFSLLCDVVGTRGEARRLVRVAKGRGS